MKPYFKTSVAKCLKDPVSTEVLETMLLLVSVEVPRELLCRWTAKQRAIAEDWAVRLHLSASDNRAQVPRKPAFVTRAERSNLPKGKPSLRTSAVLQKQREGTLNDLLIGGGR